MACDGSGFFPNTIVGPFRPPMQVIQWDIAGESPSGFRHIESGFYRPFSKIGNVGGWTGQNELFNKLDFGEAIFNPSGFETETIAITANLGELNSHPSSFFNLATGVATNFKLFNIRFWLKDDAAFSGFDRTWYFQTSADWRQNYKLTDSNPSIQIVPSSLPGSFNVPVKTDQFFASGSYKDLEFSHFIYVFGAFASGAPCNLGTYNTDFTFRVTYDWTAEDADIFLPDTTNCFSLSPPSTPAETLLNELRAYWKLDEADSATRADVQGNNDLTNQGLTTGVLQGAAVSAATINSADFIESDDAYLRVASPTADISFGNEDCMFVFWVNFDTFNGVNDLVVKFDDDLANGLEYLIRYNNTASRFEFFVSSDGSTVAASVNATTFGAASTSTWYMVTCFHDSVNDTINIQIDNGTVDSAALTTGLFSGNNATFDLGSRQDVDTITYLDGRMDALGIWGRILTEGERAWLFDSAAARQHPFAE